MCQYLVVQYMMRHQKYVPGCSCTVHDEASEMKKTSELCVSIQVYSTWRNIRNLCQNLVVEYTMKHHKYVSLSSCTLLDEASALCTRIQWYSIWRNISNMCQYLVVQYMTKHQKYVPVSSCTVHDETSAICSCTYLYITR